LLYEEILILGIKITLQNTKGNNISINKDYEKITNLELNESVARVNTRHDLNFQFARVGKI
jgi:hypothetical protein